MQHCVCLEYWCWRIKCSSYWTGFLCLHERRKIHLERKSSNEELHRQGYNPDTENVDVLIEEMEDKVHFIRSRHVDGVKTGFGENIKNVGYVDLDNDQQSNTPAILYV